MNRRMIIFLVLVRTWGGPKALGILTDWLWFTDLGFAGVYRTRLLAQVTLFILGAAGGLGLVSGRAVLATRLGRPARGPPYLLGSGLLNERQFAVTVAGGSLLVGFMLAGGFSGQWDQILRFLRPTAFGAADPLFGPHIAFFAFRLVLPQLPTRTDEETEPWSPASLRLVLSRPMKAHLFGLGAALFLLLAWGYRLSVYELGYSPPRARLPPPRPRLRRQLRRHPRPPARVVVPRHPVRTRRGAATRGYPPAGSPPGFNDGRCVDWGGDSGRRDLPGGDPAPHRPAAGAGTRPPPPR